MVVYDIKIYDLKTDSETTVIVLPERRNDYDRPRDRITVEKWARSLLGKEWWLENWHNIVIRKRAYRGRGNGNGSNGDGPRPPRRGGVDIV